MKIGILTQPLKTNYGCLLQNFALQTVLKQLGHEVWTINRDFGGVTILIKFLSIVKRIILSIFYRRFIVIRALPTTNEQNLIAQNMNRFIKENICTTEKIISTGNFSLLKKYGFNVYIVGSDQIWRPNYSPCINNYFLDFVNVNDKVKRIAYAASFGVDNWEFSLKQTTRCALLVKQFDTISVREDTAVRLCKEYLGIDAVHVLDPTMLLTKEDYIKLAKKDNIQKSTGTLMTYVLDESPENNDIIQKLTKELNLKPFSVMPQKKFSEVGKKHLADCIFPPVSEWLRGFIDAEYVVTDSFHGTVFSIIFNKPFICIDNEQRGLTRFKSLLKMFGLENQLIRSIDELTLEKIKGNIEFDRVNQIWDKEQKKAYLFLKNALN